MSALAYHFIGGVLKHVKPLLALTAASINSYKRLVPCHWASAYSCYGIENREGAIRVPMQFIKREMESTNLEMKFVDGTSNPYLAVGSVLAAGMDGIEKKIEPPEPCQANPYELSEGEKKKMGIERYPETFKDAIDELDKDDFFRKVWEKLLIDEYIKTKRFAWESYFQQVTEWERRRYLEAF